MLSSTSSSSDRLPTVAPIRTWVFSVALALAVLSGVETFWRSMGYAPTVLDDTNLWCQQRDRVNSASPDHIVLIGHSRIHQAWVPDVFDEVVPGFEHIQLGLFNAAPMAVFRDIAENTEFAGVVVCSTLSFTMLPELWRATDKDRYAGPIVRYYHETWALDEKTDRTISNFWQENFVVSFPDLAPHKVAPDLLRGEWPKQQTVWTETDRTQRVDYEKMDTEKYGAQQFQFLKDNIAKTIELESFKTWPKDNGYDELERLVQLIEDRGGRVVFLRPVTSGAYEEYAEEWFPRSKFWDLFAESMSIETIHFQDIPELASMVCPDGSHLSKADARTFTRTMANELIKRGLIRNIK
ncbi:hypothetical protein ACFL2H_09225 [Planctomycetota bacterium]